MCIAKFPHRGDEWDVMRWEAVAAELAGRAGIEVPAHRLVEVDAQGVLLLQRFDRHAGQRLGYISAMTLIGGRDGDAHDYLDVAEALADVSGDAVSDLRRLWTRAAFAVAFRNTDDHLRNLGFLAMSGGWRLAPSFDVNPDPTAGPRTTGICGAVDVPDEVDGLIELADACGLGARSLAAEARRVAVAAARWRDVAQALGVTARDMGLFAASLDDACARVAALGDG